jgi:hypothetical protein
MSKHNLRADDAQISALSAQLELRASYTVNQICFGHSS